jgi:hypothetical protein
VGVFKNVVLKEVVQVVTTTGDALVSAVQGKRQQANLESETIIMNVGNELKVKTIISGMTKSLAVGAKPGSGVSQPRVIFFKASKVGSGGCEP